MIRRAFTLLSLSVLGALGPAASAPAVPADEAIIPLEHYATPKARGLATAYRSQLAEMREEIYHCMPGVEVHKHGIGFRQPKGAAADDGYLSIWIIVDQHGDGRWAAVGPARRASAMFSRYGVDLLRRMAGVPGVLGDAGVHGLSVVVSWPKPEPNGRPGVQPVNETLVLFVDKGTALGFLAGTLPAVDFTDRARFVVFDGKEELGRLPLEMWEDPFVGTFKLENYQPAAGRQC
jgi:hypothetical protein